MSVIIVVVCISILTGLGVWQLQRAEQKKQLIEQQSKQLSTPVIELNPDIDELDGLRFHRVFIQGEFDCQHQILLDNKLYNGRPGFHVITALRPKSTETAVLINRGWISMRANRTPDPDYLNCPQGIVRIQGIVTDFPALGYHFPGSTDSQSDRWPQLMLELDAEKLAGQLNYPIADYLLLMDKSMPWGYARDWDISPSITPEKHVAYAIQWFGLAVVLSLITLWKFWRNRQ